MTFEDFLALIREHIGPYCTDEYWRWTYSTLKDKSRKAIEKELPFLAVNAVATDYASKYAGRRQ